MALYKTGFVVTDVLEVHRLFTRLSLEAGALGRVRDPRLRAAGRARQRKVRLAYGEFIRELERLAVTGAVVAERRVKARLAATQVRPDTGTRPGIADSIVARPTDAGLGIPTGYVGIGDVDVLDRVVNPRSPGYGPYWRIQEGIPGHEEYRGHIGRRIHGVFLPSGDPPVSGAGRADAIFRPGTGGGPGTIREPIRARHFIRDGARSAYRVWLAELKALEQRAIARL